MKPIAEIHSDFKAVCEIGVTPELLRIMMAQQATRLRASARRNDSSPEPGMTSFETLRSQLEIMNKMLPEQIARWAAIRADIKRRRVEKIMAVHDPAERVAAIAALNDTFRDRAPSLWQDDMSGACDPNSIGSEG